MLMEDFDYIYHPAFIVSGSLGPVFFIIDRPSLFLFLKKINPVFLFQLGSQKKNQNQIGIPEN